MKSTEPTRRKVAATRSVLIEASRRSSSTHFLMDSAHDYSKWSSAHVVPPSSRRMPEVIKVQTFRAGSMISAAGSMPVGLVPGTDGFGNEPGTMTTSTLPRPNAPAAAQASGRHRRERVSTRPASPLRRPPLSAWRRNAPSGRRQFVQCMGRCFMTFVWNETTAAAWRLWLCARASATRRSRGSLSPPRPP